MNLFDLCSLLVVVFFCLWGTRKGFIIEISEIGGLIFSFILAFYFPLNLNIGLTKYVVSFLVYFFAISMFFFILSKIIRKTPLAFIDRILGGAIGALKGLIVTIILFLIVSLIPFNGTKNNLQKSFFYKTALIARIPLENFLRRKTDDLKNYKEKITPPQKQETIETQLGDKQKII